MNASSSARLGDLVEILSGFAFDAANFSDVGGIALIRIRDVLRGHSNTFYIGEYDPRYVINAGEILIGMDGEFNRARWQSDPALLNQRVCRITSCDARLSDDYLFHFLPAALKSIEEATSFVTVKHLSVKQIREIEIPLPAIEEQRRIAAILDKAETLRTQRRAALAQLDSLVQSVFLAMFGDPASNPQAFPRMKLGELIAEGPQNGLYKSSTEYGSGTPILRIDAFYDGVVTKLDSLKRVKLSSDEIKLFGLAAGDIVINRVNSIEYLGKSALIPPLLEPTVFESNMMRFTVRLDQVEPGYLIHFLQTPFIKGQILSGSKNAVNQSSINQQDVKGFRVNVPPLPLQKTFATRIKAIEALKDTHRVVLAELNALFASLQHRAFSGELASAKSVQPAASDNREELHCPG